MAKTKVKNDSHGMYVRGGGYLFRPLFPENSGYAHAYDNGTQFSVGDQVTVTHESAGPIGTVKKDGNKESWYSHGSYFDFENNMKVIKSDLIFIDD